MKIRPELHQNFYGRIAEGLQQAFEMIINIKKPAIRFISAGFFIHI